MDPEYDVVIAGSGASGLGMAVRLLKQYPNIRLRLIEKATGPGGTWFHNTYPGCGCDIPSHFYSYSFEPKADWSKAFALQPEIHEYFSGVANKYNVPSITTYSTAVNKAVWDEDQSIWTIHTKHNDGSEAEVTARCFVSAVGGLTEPNDYKLAGLETFQGDVFHSARWKHSISLTNKNIVVVGNGCSASQFVPVIAPQVKSLTQVVRSAQWYMPQPKFPHGGVFQWIMTNVPWALRGYRFFLFVLLDLQFSMFMLGNWWGEKLRNRVTQNTLKHMRDHTPEKYHDIVLPNYLIGCKRRVLDSGYLDSLHRENVELTNKKLVKASEKSMVLEDGSEVPCDVLIVANGFRVQQKLHGMKIYGKSGIEIQEHWNQIGGVGSYQGTLLSSFPNFFLILGPNTATGHHSVIFTSECQISLSLKLIHPILSNYCTTVSVTPEAEINDIQWLQRKLKKSVWLGGGCSSWYQDEKGRNTTLYPDPQWKYWVRSVVPQMGHFEFKGGEGKGGVGELNWSVGKAWTSFWAWATWGITHSEE